MPLELPLGQAVIHDFAGRPLQAQAIVEDLTERKNLEEALRARAELEDRLQNIFASAPGVLCTLKMGPDGTLCVPFCTGAIETIYPGLKIEDLALDAEPLFAFAHPDDVSGLKESIRESARTLTPWRHEYRVLHPERGEIWIEANSLPRLQSDGSILWHGFMLEITERKRAQEEIKRNAAWLKSVIATTQDAVISIDRQARVVLFNPAAEKMFGYTNDEVVGNKVNILMAEPYASEHDGYIERYERTGATHVIGAVRTVMARRKTGDLFPIQISVAEIVTDQQVPYVAIIRDVSENSRLEAQLVESERLAAIGSTAAKLGHEIANPLNGISLGIELLEKRIAKQANSPDPELDKSIKRLKNEIRNLRQVVGQFRSISRKEKYNFEPSLLTELVKEVVEFERPYFEQIRVEVETRFPADFPPCNIDRAKMTQVLLNLLKNAAESMPNGGKITVDANASERTVSVEIGDTGTGIPLGFDPFEPFVTTKKDGTGIGLVISRQIVAAHHGRLSCQSRADQGTTFRIELPRK